MGEGLRRRVEFIKQQVPDIALNVCDRFKEKGAGKADNEHPIRETIKE
jgi:hypothetical protein